MHRARSDERGTRRAGERGQAIVVAAIAMVALLAIAAYAINTAEWWDHSHHLQAQADAAALDGALEWSAGCAGGSTADTNIAQAVAQYSGSGSATWENSSTQQSVTTSAGTGNSVYNQQLYPTPTSSNLVALINSDTFGTPTYGNGLTGDPCTDSTLDVKLTEENLSSLVPSVNPGYINAEAKVGFFSVTTADKVEPFVFEMDVPKYMWVELVDENSYSAGGTAKAASPANPCTAGDDGVNPTVVLGWAPLGEGSGTWSGQLIPCSPSTATTPGPVSFTSSKSTSSGTFPVGLRVIASAYPTSNANSAGYAYPPQCPLEWDNEASGGSTNAWSPNGVVCYDVGPPNPALGGTQQEGDELTDNGAAFVRVYDNSTNTPGATVHGASGPAAPQADDVWLVSDSSGSNSDLCGSSEGTDSSNADWSNFYAGDATVQLCANMNFGSSVTCAEAGLDLWAVPSLPALSTQQVTMNPPANCTTPNATWYSNAYSLEQSGSEVSGPTNFELGWTLETGNVPIEYNSSNAAAGSDVVYLQQVSGSQNLTNGKTTVGYQQLTANPLTIKVCGSGNLSESCTNCNSGTPCYCSSTYPCICDPGTYTCASTTTCSSEYQCLGSFDGTPSAGDPNDSDAPETVQRGFDGASDQFEDSYSRAGPVETLTLYDNSTGLCSGTSIQSLARATSDSLTACASLISPFQDDYKPAQGDAIALNAGDDDFSGEWDCYEPTYGSSNSGSPAYGGGTLDQSPQVFNLEMQWWIEEGCNGKEIPANNGTQSTPLTSEPSPQSPPNANTLGAPTSADYYYYQVNPDTDKTGKTSDGDATCWETQPEAPTTVAGADDCVEGVSDNDITWNIMAALNERILGCTNAQCIGNTPTCNDYWNGNNSLTAIENNFTDPRLVTLPLTDFGQFFPNSYAPVPPGDGIPITGFANFYITGWWGDPCTSDTAPAGVTGLSFVNTATETASTDDTPAADTDAAEAVTADQEVDDGSYSENSSGNMPSGYSNKDYGYDSGCTSTSPGYDFTNGNYQYCTDQGLLLGHFVKTVTVEANTIPSTTLCTANTLDPCAGILEK